MRSLVVSECRSSSVVALSQHLLHSEAAVRVPNAQAKGSPTECGEPHRALFRHVPEGIAAPLSLSNETCQNTQRAV